jgi:hypothetical protein
MRAFDCSRCAVRSALANRLNRPKSRGRHLAVDAESDLNLLAWIREQAQKNAAVTHTDIKNSCHEVWKFQASRGWVALFISRHSAELTEKKSSPQEEPRLQVPRSVLEETICSMHETLQGCPADLGCNLDEVGISERDGMNRTVIKYREKAVHAELSPSVSEGHFLNERESRRGFLRPKQLSVRIQIRKLQSPGGT